MRYEIDERDLDVLLAQKAKYIGRRNVDWIDILNGIIVAITAITSHYFKMVTLNTAVKLVLFISGTLAVVMEIINMVRMKTDNYTAEQMKSDIASLNKVQKNYSIIAVRDCFRVHTNRFLQYYDEGWKCWFF